MKVHNANQPVATCDEIEHGEFGVGYRGCQDKTRDGQQCINWADQYVADGEKPYDNANYPEGIEENPGNMCRNPAGDNSGIWCFTLEHAKILILNTLRSFYWYLYCNLLKKQENNRVGGFLLSYCTQRVIDCALPTLHHYLLSIVVPEKVTK